MKLSRRKSAAKLGELIAGPFIPAVVMFVLSALSLQHGHLAFGVGSLLWGLLFAEFGIRDLRRRRR